MKNLLNRMLGWFDGWFTRPRNEASNSFAMFIVMLPMLIGAFGIGVDTARNVYIRSSLQNALDMGTVAGAAVTRINANSRVVIDGANAVETVEIVYAANRRSVALVCIGDRTIIPQGGGAKCWRTVNVAVQPNYIRYVARERSKNAFLPIVGVETQRYTVRSTARLRQTNR